MNEKLTRSSATAEIARVGGLHTGHCTVQGHSRSPVSVFGTNRKAVCDFLLVNNLLTYILSRTVSKLLRFFCSLRVRQWGYLSLTCSFSTDLYEYHYASYIAKTRIFRLHFYRRFSFNSFDVAHKVTKFRDITQYNVHYLVQGHFESRSPILEPIESSYATLSY